jgi:uncharacterized protein DUF4838/glycosyl hydrolase family 67
VNAKTTLFTLTLVVVLLFAAPSARADTSIVVDFGPHASPQIAGHAEDQVNWLDADESDDTICTHCFAALELQRYLRTMTGRADDFTLVDDDHVPDDDLLLVGAPGFNRVSHDLADRLGVENEELLELGAEGYRIKTADVDSRQVTIVAGGGRVGTLYGAYDLLYRQGCRWFGLGDLHEVVPRTGWEPDFDVRESPDFATRGFHAWQHRAGPEFLLWMARNRLNYWCVEQEEHSLMHKLGLQMSCGGHDPQNRFLAPYAAYPYNHPIFDGDEGLPPDPYPVSEQYQGDANRGGKLSYFEAHPEWYALVKGIRVPGMRKDNPGFGTNYCTSNAHATDEFMKNCIQAFIDGPYRYAGVVRFWTLDVGKWCECDACKKLGSRTDRYMLLVHRLDQEIKKARAEGRIHRPIIIRFLAYADVLDPPTRPLPEGFDYSTCSATFFPIVRCYVHCFDDKTCSKNARYMKQLQGWATDPDRHYRGSICIGEYYNVSGYRNLPICFMHTMAHDIPYFHRTGARHFHYMHVTTGNWGNKALTNYQMARQLWDIDLDKERLWHDYFSARYGSSATTMREFYESLEMMLANVSELKYGLAGRLHRGSADLFPTTHLRYQADPTVESNGIPLTEIVTHAQTCRELIDRALATNENEVVRKRIAEDKQAFTYGERTVLFYDACTQAYQFARSGEVDKARLHFDDAKHLADLLQQDTVSVSLCYTPNDANALVASRALGALEKLEAIMEAKR